LLATKSANPGSSSARNSRLGVAPVLEDALVAGRARVAHVDTAQLPHDPIGGLDPALHRAIDLGIADEQLEALGVLPLGGDQPAIARQPRLTATRRQLVDAVGLRLRRMVLPQLDVRVRPVLELGEIAQRRAVGQRRNHRAGGEVGADADHVRRVDAGVGDRAAHGGTHRLDVVLRILQRPVRRQRFARDRQAVVDHGVPIRVHRRSHLGAVGDADDDRPRG
jgi:hypothetical protein